MDYFFIGEHAYLVIVDRYSGWPSVFHFRPGQTTAGHLISVLRNHFATFGIPEESSSDGGPQFESQEHFSARGEFTFFSPLLAMPNQLGELKWV